MRGLLAGLIVACLVVALALLASGVAAVGVAAIGWLLSRWFDLTQWQGTLVALAVSLGLGYIVFNLTNQAPSVPWTAEPDEDAGEDDEEYEEAEPPAPEPPIVPWRRSRPTQGVLPSEKPGAVKQQGKK